MEGFRTTDKEYSWDELREMKRNRYQLDKYPITAYNVYERLRLVKTFKRRTQNWVTIRGDDGVRRMVRALGTGTKADVFLAIDELTRVPIALKAQYLANFDEVEIYRWLATGQAGELPIPEIYAYFAIEEEGFILQELVIGQDMYGLYDMTVYPTVDLVCGSYQVLLQLVQILLLFLRRRVVHSDLDFNNLIWDEHDKKLYIIDLDNACIQVHPRSASYLPELECPKDRVWADDWIYIRKWLVQRIIEQRKRLRRIGPDLAIDPVIGIILGRLVGILSTDWEGVDARSFYNLVLRQLYRLAQDFPSLQRCGA